ncbi:MAG: hypothetical protein PHU56_02590 [Candidatus Pacebacteria bacterium]|nr:hypothetical protein [Candidatus Paceibacterota bacterium]
MIKTSKIVAIAAVIVVGGVLFSLASGLWNPGWNPFKPVSGDIFLDSLSKSLAAKTFNLSGLLEVEAETTAAALGGNDSQSKVVKIGLETQEQIDKTDSENIKASGQINLGMETEGMAISGNFEVLGLGDDAYFKIVSLPSFLPLPVDLEKAQGQWIKLSLKDLQDKLAAAGLPLQSGYDSQDFQTTLKNLKEIAADKKLFEVKRHFGKEEVSGMYGQHYSMALNKKAVKDFIPAYLGLAERYAPEDQKEEIRQQLAEFEAEFDANFDRYWETFGGLTFDIWVEQGSGRLIKFVWEKELDPAKLGQVQQDIKKMKLRVEAELSQFNEKFDIEEPVGFITAQELLGNLAQHLAPSTSTTSTLP